MGSNTQVVGLQYNLIDWYRPLTQTLNSLYQKVRKLKIHHILPTGSLVILLLGSQVYLNVRLNGLEQKLGQVEKRLEVVEQTVDGLQKKIEQLQMANRDYLTQALEAKRLEEKRTKPLEYELPESYQLEEGLRLELELLPLNPESNQ